MSSRGGTHGRRAVAAVSIGLLAWAAGTSRAEEDDSSPEPGGPLRRQAYYQGLFPFYSHEGFEDGSARTRAAVGLIRIDREADGSFRHGVLPLYDASRSPAREEHRLAIYPLLFFHGRSPGEGYDIAGPFAHWHSAESRHLLLWPLFHSAREPSEAPFRYLPTLFRQGTWADGTLRQRLGIPLLLEVAEGSRSKGTSAWTFLNAFNFDAETEGGLPLARARIHEDGNYSAHLFPLAFLGRSPERRYLYTPLAAWWSAPEGSSGIVIPPALSWLDREAEAFRLSVLWPFFRLAKETGSTSIRLFPLYFEKEDRERGDGYRFLIPFHGLTWSGDGRREHYVPLLLAHYHATGEGGVSMGALWPLLHYSREDHDLEMRVLPVLDHRRRGTRQHSGVGIVLYRSSFHDGESAEHWVLWPLLRRKTSPERSIAWFLPLFCRDVERSRSREADVTFVAPGLYLEDSKTKTPLAVDEPRFSFEEKRKRILWPLFSDSTTRTWLVDGEADEAPLQTPQRTPYLDSWTRFVLPPLISWDHEVFETDDEPRRSYHAWPLVHMSRGPGSEKVAVVPLLFTGRAPGRSYAYLYPLAAVERGSGSQKTFGLVTSLIQWQEDDERTHLHLFPLIFKYSKKPEGTSVTGLFGSVLYRSSEEGGWFHLFPLGFGMWESDRVSFGVFPFYLRRRHGEEGIRYWNAARLLFLWNDLSSPRERHWSLFWKFIQRTSDVEGNHEFRILHRLVVHRNVKGQRELILNPFFRSFSDAQTGESSLDVLKVIYRRERKDGEDTVRILGIPFGQRG